MDDDKVISYNYFEVDTGDIYTYEFQETQIGEGADFTILDKLRKMLPPLMILRCKPFINPEQGEEYKQWYADNYEANNELQRLDYFKWGAKYYEYATKNPVFLDQNEMDDFAFLFTLKLGQYHDNLAMVDGFLYHQAQHNFNGKLERFKPFLESVFLQYESLLGQLLEKKTLKWVEGFNPSMLGASPDEWMFETPGLWFKPPLSIGDDQVKRFLSFLYLERNDFGEPLLSKDDFDRIFRKGFLVPPKPYENKYSLNLTPRYKKALVEKGIYLLYSKWTRNYKLKTEYLRFLAYTFREFEHCETQKDFLNWGKNLTRKRMEKETLIDFNKYEKMVLNS